MSVILGCIADDFTGATDLASFLVASGMRTIQLTGLPDDHIALPDADAVVVALKSRTQKTEDAVADSLAALKLLQSLTLATFLGIKPPSGSAGVPLAEIFASKKE